MLCCEARSVAAALRGAIGRWTGSRRVPILIAYEGGRYDPGIRPCPPCARAVARRLYGPQGRGRAYGLSQAEYGAGQGRSAAPGAVPGARFIEFRALVVRSDRARRRILDDECLRRARLRRVDDGSRELRPLVAHRGQFGYRQRGTG